jgi:UDPglucose 6-dehydrogenase
MSASVKAPVVIVGAGYVGLVTAVGFAQARDVRLVDQKTSLIEELEAGELPFFEPDLERRFKDCRKRLSFHTQLEDALRDGLPQLVFIAVGTPKRGGGNGSSNGHDGGDDGDGADLGSVYAVIDSLLNRSEVAAVMKSTVPPGTGRKMLEYAGVRGSDLTYLSCPEFLREGDAFTSFDRPDRIVIGYEGEPSWAVEALRELHADVHQGTPRCFEMKLINAEAVKHASNLKLAIRISYANQIGNFCEELPGADVSEVMAGVGADKRIGEHFLRAGAGFGGSCFDKDIRAFRSVAKREADIELSLVDVVLSINKGQIERTIAKLERRLGTLREMRIAILGLAFKPGTDDLRESPALALASELHRFGATLRAWDPRPGARQGAVAKGPQKGLAHDEVATSALEAMEEADAVVLMTDWPEFAEIEWTAAAAAMGGKLVIDGRNHLPPDEVRAAGLEYEGTGRESRGLTQPLPEGATDG